MTPAILSAAVLLGALVLFVSERVRHDLVALLALLACVLLGLTPPAEAFAGFADPAVIAVAAVLVIGRAIELSGVAASVSRVLMPARAGFTVRLAVLLVLGAFLSAFMNNIAALVVTMPIAAQVAREAKRPPAATLMPLAFATILGGMTTLIGTPANLILSSVRAKELGTGFGFFQMAPVGVAVSAVGLLYLVLVGWRLLPVRQGMDRPVRPPWRVYELTVPAAVSLAGLLPRLRTAAVRLLAAFREGHRIRLETGLEAGDRLLVVSRRQQWIAAEATGLRSDIEEAEGDSVTARVVVAHGSFLIGLSHEAIRIRSNDTLTVVAVGPRAARRRAPLASLRIEAGDQLFVRGRPADLARFVGTARLLEVDRVDRLPVARRQAAPILMIFIAAIVSIVGFGAPPALAFLAAAVALVATRLMGADEVYQAIDWSVIVLLAAMIPVGHSFETSGAAAIAAEWLGATLAGLPPVVVIAALCSMTLLLSIFLNNVATAIIMGPLAIDAARVLGIGPDAALLAVLIGTSADFLTPIGHQNNLLVMGPGGYRFTDYARMGAVLVVLVVGTAAMVLALP
ncbi:SLC13 family permease [Sphingomonas sp. TDK1]|uniref:SLC13 family permease n=1 Tax=Sphingomonas sp. TDK1 TaxID=453247 RepID=UPI0007D98FE2|nr:SLC13 family permease [Sphingomonas sp. TDK1]OAN65704.1 citrate transporter [Sphingomonas sp. TDK1]